MYSEVVQSIYQAVLPSFTAQFPGIPITAENQPFDWANPEPKFAEVEVVFYDADQISLSESPGTRLHGYLYVCIYAKEGLGTMDRYAMIDWFSDLLKYQVVGPVQFRAPAVEKNDPPRGWHTLDLKCPFYADRP